MKKIYLLALLSSCLSLSIFANGVEIDGIYYLLNDADFTASVTYTGSSYSSNNSYTGEVVIPSSVEYDNHVYSVTSIGQAAFKSCESLTSVTIPNSVTSIGSATFCYCGSLTSITIPNTVTSIGDTAFYNCSSLTSVTIGNSVRSIGGFAFSVCSSLTSVTIPNSVTSIGRDAFDYCIGLTSVHISDVAAWCSISFENADANPLCYSHKLYLNGTLVTNLVIPNSVTSIRSYAFEYCSSLTSVTIPNSVTSIGKYAFYGCSSLTSVTIGNSVTSIGERTFDGCSGLTSVTIGNSVTSIGDDAFAFCTSLTSVYISDIAAWCAINFVNVTSNPLYYAHELYQKIVSDIDIYAVALDLVIPNSITCIKNYTFCGYSSLTSVTIPNSVTSIGEYAFYYCSSLTSVYCEALDPPSLGNSAFSLIPDTAILFVPCESLEAYSAISGYADSFSEIRGIPSYAEDITETTATLKWLPDTAVTQYEINVYQDSTRFAQYIVDAHGELISSQRFAPSIYHHKLDTTTSSTEYFVISLEGLSAGTDYNYTIDGTNAESAPVYHEEGTFTTLNEGEGFLDAIADDPRKQTKKILREGQLLILRNGRIYTLNGTEIQQTQNQ